MELEINGITGICTLDEDYDNGDNSNHTVRHSHPVIGRYGLEWKLMRLRKPYQEWFADSQ